MVFTSPQITFYFKTNSFINFPFWRGEIELTDYYKEVADGARPE